MLRGRIIKNISNSYVVKTKDKDYTCTPRGKFREIGLTPLVGDIVEIDEENKVEFTVTGVTDSRCNIKAVGSVKIPQTDGSEDKVQSISGSMEWSVGGGAG